LSRKGIRGYQERLGAACLQCAREVGGLSRDVRTGNQAHTLQRLFSAKAFANQPQHGHFSLSPINPALAVGGERDVLNVMFKSRHSSTHLRKAPQLTVE